MRKSKTAKSVRGVRIIGGSWRGRRLAVAAAPHLRPTPDRVRETLFNWLADIVPGARCLDLFAGTGVLGFEALSRGAAHTAFVENNPNLVAELRSTAALLAADCSIHQAGAMDYLRETRDSFDLVFLDPPYQLPVAPVLAVLRDRLKESGLVYVERASAAELAALQSRGSLRKTARAGAVHYGLWQATAPG